ncbi:hypothetical protein [Streptomyces sp. NPDC059131]|uniref:hypothetical protein n=1 Tax=Streptomyces sp. NPDC059131 TaxID=3346736 RepID=UPI0036B19BDD
MSARSWRSGDGLFAEVLNLSGQSVACSVCCVQVAGEDHEGGDHDAQHECGEYRGGDR